MHILAPATIAGAVLQPTWRPFDARRHFVEIRSPFSAFYPPPLPPPELPPHHSTPSSPFPSSNLTSPFQSPMRDSRTCSDGAYPVTKSSTPAEKRNNGQMRQKVWRKCLSRAVASAVMVVVRTWLAGKAETRVVSTALSSSHWANGDGGTRLSRQTAPDKYENVETYQGHVERVPRHRSGGVPSITVWGGTCS